MGYRTYIDFFEYDEAKYPIPPKPVTPGATECAHTAVPEGYIEWHEWAKRASNTHSPVRCPKCGRWSIWFPKADAKVINRAHDKAVREFVKAEKRQRQRGQYDKLKKKLGGTP